MVLGIILTASYIVAYILIYKEINKLPDMIAKRIRFNVKLLTDALDEFLLHYDDSTIRFKDTLLFGV